MDDKHLKMCILLAGYRNAIEDFRARRHEDIDQSVIELLDDVDREEEHFKINEEKQQ